MKTYLFQYRRVVVPIRNACAVAKAFSPQGLTFYQAGLVRNFSVSPKSRIRNRVYDPITTPPTFHDYLRVCSASNTLLLVLFTTSSCAPCRTITPLLKSLVSNRPASTSDRFSAVAFTEAELDSGDTSNGSMMDLGVEYGISSVPTLVGFGGRRSERITDRLSNTRTMGDKVSMEKWVDDAMQKGDPNATGGGGGGILGRLFS